MKQLSITLLFSLLVTITKSQSNNIGITFLPTYTYSIGDLYTKTKKPTRGYSLGLKYIREGARKLGWSVGVEYEYKTLERIGYPDGIINKVEEQNQQIRVPIHLQMKLGEWKKMPLTLSFGPNISYSFDAVYAVDHNLLEDKVFTFKRGNYPYHWKGGIDIQAGITRLIGNNTTFHIRPTYSFNLSLDRLNRYPKHIYFHDLGIFLMVSYQF